MLNANPYGPDGKLTTPFYLNVYLDEHGAHSIPNPVATRQASIAAALEGVPLNSRVRVIRVKGLRHRPDYDLSCPVDPEPPP